MQEEKGKEIFVVSLSDALINPNAVVVGLLDAHLTHGAVFAAGWLVKFACLTFPLRCKEQRVIFIATNCSLVRLLCNVAWVYSACLVIAVIAGSHQQCAHILMDPA